MNIKELVDWIRSSKQQVLIEAEAKPSRMSSFIAEHNAAYSRTVSTNDEGIVLLQDDANKWGLELRIYFQNKRGMPSAFSAIAKVNNTYKDQYLYRINDNEIIEELFSNSFHIGIN